MAISPTRPRRHLAIRSGGAWAAVFDNAIGERSVRARPPIAQARSPSRARSGAAVASAWLRAVWCPAPERMRIAATGSRLPVPQRSRG